MSPRSRSSGARRVERSGAGSWSCRKQVESTSSMPSRASSSATPPMSASVLRRGKPQQHLEHSYIGQRAAENLDVLDLSGHDRALDALALEEANHLPQLTDADPRDAPVRRLRDALNDRVGLFANRRDRQRARPRAARLRRRETGNARCLQSIRNAYDSSTCQSINADRCLSSPIHLCTMRASPI